jgi:hypothetical protein
MAAYPEPLNGLIPMPKERPRVRSTALTDDLGTTQINRQLRELFREAFDQLGGSAWLVEFAEANDQNARVFVQAISKLLPASAADRSNVAPVILDVPWLTRDRLSYKDAAAQITSEDSQITDVPDTGK